MVRIANLQGASSSLENLDQDVYVSKYRGPFAPLPDEHGPSPSASASLLIGGWPTSNVQPQVRHSLCMDRFRCGATNYLLEPFPLLLRNGRPVKDEDDAFLARHLRAAI